MRLPKLKQHNIPWLGAFTESLFESLPILSIFNFMSILIVLYATVYEIVHEFAPWLTFWHFVGALAIVVSIGLILVHKYVVPSLWTFRQNQMLQHESDMSEQVKQMQEQLNRIEKLLKENKNSVI